MQTVDCNFCGGSDSELVSRGPDLLLNIPGDFRLVCCRHCGLIYQNPQLSRDELAKHYPDSYLPYQTEKGESRESALARLSRNHGVNRQCWRVENKVSTSGSLLDIGCATGTFIKAMAQRGWRVRGIEPSPFASAYARDVLELDVQTGTLDAFESDEPFDVVTLWDVLEHVHDPMATLARANRLLKPGGLLVVSLPNPTSIERTIFKDSWVGWERPRHLFLFTPKIMKAYLRKAGFALKTIESFNGRLSLTLLSVEFWLRAKQVPEQRWRPWLARLYSWPLRVATWPLYRVGELINKTSVMTVFATKEREVETQ